MAEIAQLKTTETKANDALVKTLEEQLEQARTGELVGGICVMFRRGGTISVRGADSLRLSELVGLLEIAKLDAVHQSRHGE